MDHQREKILLHNDDLDQKGRVNPNPNPRPVQGKLAVNYIDRSSSSNNPSSNISNDNDRPRQRPHSANPIMRTHTTTTNNNTNSSNTNNMNANNTNNNTNNTTTAAKNDDYISDDDSSVFKDIDHNTVDRLRQKVKAKEISVGNH